MTLDSQILKIKFVDHIAKKMHGKRMQMITFIPDWLFILFYFFLSSSISDRFGSVPISSRGIALHFNGQITENSCF